MPGLHFKRDCDVRRSLYVMRTVRMLLPTWLSRPLCEDEKLCYMQRADMKDRSDQLNGGTRARYTMAARELGAITAAR